MKDVGLRIRVQRELRDSFLEACRRQDIPAAQVIREFMREYVRKHGRYAASRAAAAKPEKVVRGQHGNKKI